MVHVRAPAILARQRWVVERYGQAEHDAMLAAMAPAQASEVRAAVMATQWVPFDAFVALSLAIDTRFGKGDLALCKELGAYSADVNLPTLYRIFYKLGTVPYIISKAAAVWSAHYDSGTCSATESRPGEVKVLVEAFATPHRAHCMSVLGWLEESVRISGGRLLRSAEVACRTRGAPRCEFSVRYE